ncbi:MAG: hypothetical protein WCG78_08800, partial [Candidatus Omnitrophota bacterium]
LDQGAALQLILRLAGIGMEPKIFTPQGRPPGSWPPIIHGDFYGWRGNPGEQDVKTRERAWIPRTAEGGTRESERVFPNAARPRRGRASGPANRLTRQDP